MRFGTSGLRGRVAAMTDPVCAAYAAAFLAHARRSGAVDAVLVGRDLRPSSPRIAAACRAAIAAAGATAVDCGVLPTPALALEAARRGCPGIMVTGSHIPADRNGLKFYLGSREITKADEAGIVGLLGEPLVAGTGSEAADDAVLARYAGRYLSFVPALSGLRVGVFEHSAAGREILGAVLQEAGATVVRLGHSDDFVAIDTEAVEPGHVATIAAWVGAHGLDALVATDGDGDRPLVADEAGRILRGDVVGTLTARFLGADAVAVPLNASSAIERSGWFRRVVRTRIGSPHVIAALGGLSGAGLPVGFEANGGFILGGRVEREGRALAALPTRDAMLPILAVLAFASERACRLSDLVTLLPQRATASDRLPAVGPDASAPLLQALAADPALRGGLLAGLGGAAAVDTRDGVRMTLANGEIVHLRASGNAPELRCYAEAETPDRARDLVARVLARVAERLSVAAAGP